MCIHPLSLITLEHAHPSPVTHMVIPAFCVLFCGVSFNNDCCFDALPEASALVPQQLHLASHASFASSLEELRLTPPGSQVATRVMLQTTEVVRVRCCNTAGGVAQCFCVLPQEVCGVIHCCCMLPQEVCCVTHCCCVLPQEVCGLTHCYCVLPQEVCGVTHCRCVLPQGKGVVHSCSVGVTHATPVPVG
jgi:hypothetical protein